MAQGAQPCPVAAEVCGKVAGKRGFVHGSRGGGATGVFASMVSLAAVWFPEDVGECVCLEGSAVVATRQVRYVVCEAMQPFPVLCMVRGFSTGREW